MPGVHTDGVVSFADGVLVCVLYGSKLGRYVELCVAMLECTLGVLECCD